jgi:uncharacterized membrane protein
MNANKLFLFLGSFVIGVIAGLRSMTSLAAVSWGARLGWIDLRASHLAFFGSTTAVVVISAAALGELVVDKLPFTPRRTALVPLLFRVLSGAVCGAAVCISAQHFVVLGSVLGGLGAIAGSFSGYRIRHNVVRKGTLPDIAVALIEDAIAVGGAFVLISHLY